MGGGRQFTSLLRKNVLLKTRRPCATCFEISMPLVLFMLLVYVRKRMETESHGPFYFKASMIFPLSPVVWDQLVNSFGDDSNNQQLTTAATGTWDAQQYNITGNISQMAGQVSEMSDMLTQEICPPQNFERNSKLIADLMEPMLSHEFDGHSMVEELMKADASWTARYVHDSIHDMQTWNISKFIDSVDSALKDYLTHYTDDVERVAKELQKGLEFLRDGIQTPEGARVAKHKVVELTDDVVHMGSWILGNTTMSNILGERYFDKLGFNLSEWHRHLIINMSSWNMSSWNTTSLPMSSWNITYITKAWMDTHRYIERTGKRCPWFNGTWRPPAFEPLRWSMDNIGSAPDMAEDMMDMMRKSSPADAREMASNVDDASWWLSHFLRSGGLTARALGQFSTDPLNMEGMMAQDVMEDMEKKFPAEGFRTDMGGDVYQFMRTMSDSMNMSISMEDMSESMQRMRKNIMEMFPEMQQMDQPMEDAIQQMQATNMSKEVEKMSKEVEKHSEKAKEWANSFQSDVRKMLDELRKHNATSLQHNLLPEWEKEWRAWYPKHVNSTWVGDFFHRTQSGCPFYRHVIPWAAERNLTKFAHEEHHWIANTIICKTKTDCAYRRPGPPDFSPPNMSLDDVRKHLNWLQRDLRKIDATRAHEVVFNVIDGMQKNVEKFDRATMLDSLKKMNATHAVTEMYDKAIHKGRDWTTRSAAVSLAKELHRELNVHFKCEDHNKAHNQSRRLQARKEAERYDSIFNEIMSRKILIAPYTGDAKKLIDLAFVELALSLTQSEHHTEWSGFLEAVLRCPLVKALGAKGIQWFIEDRMVTFASEKDMEAYSIDHPDDVIMALVMKNADDKGDFPAGPLKVDYSIRMHAQFLPPTSRILRISRHAMFGGIRVGNYPYLDLGFGYIQEVMGRAVARMSKLRESTAAASGSGGMLNTDVVHTEVGSNIAAHAATEPGRRAEVYVRQMPAPRYDMDKFIRIIQHTMPMLLILGWIYAVSLLVKEIVYEKQERLRDVMRIMGLKTWVYWSSWMCSAMLQMTGLVTFITLILSGGRVIKYSNPLILFMFFWVYSMATVSFSLLISSFFSRAKVAAACGGLAYYVAYLPYGLFNRFEDVMTIHAKNALCLLSSSGLGCGMSIIAKFELIEEGLQWHNLGSPPPVTYSGAAPKDGFSVGHVIMMFLVDTVLYQVLAWYIEKVCPGTLGLPQPFYFPLLPSFWRGSKQMATPVSLSQEDADVEQKGNEKLECWEPPPAALEAIVKIRELSKTFNNGKKALKGVTLDLHQGTILGLLGHNGAGKSTTMAILTGLYPPTDGDVFVNGRSVRKDSIGVRKQLGVCLQHNALWETMTVEEHLALFCCLKSVPWNEMKGAVDSLLRDTGLQAKRHARSNTLSGGMKRKLSIGISLSGNSQVVTLDEPTAGVDATSRRDIWQLLSAYKSQRTILLSTHFMDEADILSDRIAIIAEGQLTAIGTGIHLKRHFADSYMLTLVAADGAQAARLTKAVMDLVPEAQFAGSRGREFSYTLPFKARAKFPALFEHLQKDAAREDLGVDAYGLSATTMEEVFLQASSVHEKGLGGVVRNNNVQDITIGAPPQLDRQATATSEASTSLGSDPSGGASSGDRTNTKSDTVADDRPSTPTDQASVVSPEITKEHSGIPSELSGCSDSGIASRSIELKEDGPSSLHCMIAPSKPEAIVDIDQAGPPAAPEPIKVKHNAAYPEAVEKNPEGAAFSTPEQLSGPRLWAQQFKALIFKRALSVRRDRKAWASQLMLPALFVFLALVIAKILAIKEEEPPIKLSSDMYIGTVAAGAVHTSMDEHLIPFAIDGSGDFGHKVREAFDVRKGANDMIKTAELQNTSHYAGSMNSWLMENHQELLLESYGAVEMRQKDPEYPALVLWFRNRAYHAIPVMINLWNQARFHILGLKDTQVQVWSHPLPKSAALLQEEMSGAHQVWTDLTVAITMILAMGFIPASFVVYLVYEKASNGKHQQLLTGVSPLMYWVTSYVWDIINFLIPMLFCFFIFVVFQVAAYSGANSGAIFVLLLAYGLCMTPCMYCVEPLFSTPSTAYVTLICTNIFTGTLSVMATAVLDMYQTEAQDLKPVNSLFKAIFPWILPNYNLGRGMIEIASNHYINFAGEEFGICVHSDGECTRSALSYDVSGQFILHMFLMTPVWLLLRLLIEWRCCAGRLKERDAKLLDTSASSHDEAVVKEAERVTEERAKMRAKGDTAEDSLVIAGLHKRFFPAKSCGCCRRRAQPFHAVRGLNVGVPRGECFGLLGVNGAGKTTTMRMITGDTEIGSGDIQVGGWSVHGHKDKARRHLGYCPQFDALPDKLTTRETLALYARIRGVPPDSIQKTVQAMISRMCLEAHQHNTCEHLSGGNKRKLSTALSLIGEPDVVLLDEPSTGVDVGARRFLWDVISDIRRRGHAIVLTSHSMEECEVLCTRLTIMVDGQFQCLGTPMQLKAKYGGGYTLTVKAILGKDDQSNVCARIRDFVSQQIPNAELSEESVGLFRYGITVQGMGNDKQVPLAEIFSKLEEASAEGGALCGCVADYTISQTSLEEVFLYFSQYQQLKAQMPEAKVEKVHAAPLADVVPLESAPSTLS